MPGPIRPGLTDSKGRLAAAGPGWDASSVGAQEQAGCRMALPPDLCLGLDGAPLRSCNQARCGASLRGNPLMHDPAFLLARLRHFPLLSALDETKLADLLPKLRHRRVHASDVIFAQGTKGDELFLLLSGTVRIVSALAKGREVTLAVLTAGDFFGDMSLLDGESRSAAAYAVEDCELLSLLRSDFFKAMDGSPESIRRLLALLSGRLRKANDRLRSVSLFTVRQRLAALLHELALSRGHSENGRGVLLPKDVNHPSLARTLSTSRETVTRELAELRSQGLVAQEGRRIRIVHVEGLTALFDGQDWAS